MFDINAIISQLIAPALAGIGLYVGVRVDLARMHERIAAAVKSTEKAHERIDTLIMERRK